VLEAGADKVSVNSAALARPQLIEELAGVLGSQAVVVAIDTEDGRVRSHAATRDAARDTVEWAKECEERGAGELLVTSIDRDGTRAGYDTELLGRIRESVSLPVIASGGAGTARHVAEALGVASAALLASILHEDPRRLVSLRGELKELGVCLR
jgi:cyclase